MLLLKSCKREGFVKLNVKFFTIFGLFILIKANGVVASSCFGTCTDAMLNETNREKDFPTFPLKDDKRRQPSNIVKAHEILCKGLQDFLDFTEADLGSYLSHLIETDYTFVDEYGKEILHYHKIISWIWLQHNETVCKNYAISKYENDKLDLCSIARFLSHQPKVEDRNNIMKKMGIALKYKCHPCTPYKRKEYGENIAPNTDDISPDGVSPEESLLLCKDCDHQGICTLPTTVMPSTTPSAVALNPPSHFSPDSTTTSSTEVTSVTDSINPAFDYSPCSHWKGSVTCKEIPIGEIQRVFRRTAFPTLASVELTLQHSTILSETFIPENFLESKRASSIEIECLKDSTLGSSLMSLQVHPQAFQSTKTYTESFKFSSFNCILLDFTFLSGFEKLTDLTFWDVSNIHRCLSSLPPLHSLASLNFLDSDRSAEYSFHLPNFPTLKNGLKSIKISGEFYDFHNYETKDNFLNRILNWLLISSSETLFSIKISGMPKLTEVPVQIPSFKALSDLWLYGTNISTIKTGALAFTGPIRELYLGQNKIQKVEQGAIKGNLTGLAFNIDGNLLTTFDQNVFEPIMQQMTPGSGYIYAGENPIDCSEKKVCQLDWVRRMKVNPKLQCSDGTSFVDLKPESFNHCSVPKKVD